MTLDATRLQAGSPALGADVKQFFNLFTGVMKDQPVLFSNRLTLTRDAAVAPSSLSYLIVTGINDTAVTAEANDVWLNLNRTLQFSTSFVPVFQRAIRVSAPTYSSTGAAVLARAATLAISGPPIAGTNLTLTSAAALLVEAGFLEVPAVTGGVRFGTAGAILTSNPGTPEGVITAPIGSLCLDSSGGPPYQKTSGTGNTGWALASAVTVKSLQRGTVTISSSGNTGTATITSVNTAKAMCTFLGGISDNGINTSLCQIKLLNATTVQADRVANAAAAALVNFEVVEFY